jgi:hypothetical protein
LCGAVEPRGDEVEGGGGGLVLREVAAGGDGVDLVRGLKEAAEGGGGEQLGAERAVIGAVDDEGGL